MNASPIFRWLVAAVVLSGWPAGASPVINEIMFHPVDSSGVELPADEFIELFNPELTVADVSGWQFTKGVTYTFPANTLIPARGYLVVAANLAAFQARHLGVTNVVAGWSGSLSNRNETIELSDQTGIVVDSVNYATEGDWADRRHPTAAQTDPPNDAYAVAHGWIWHSDADGNGKSLELRNPALTSNSGQNWKTSTAAGGSAGRPNAALTVNLPPMILDVTHSPLVPTPTDLVSISADLVDETPAASLTVSVKWRVATATPGAFATLPMKDDGLAADERSGDARFTALLPAQPNGTVVEFYLTASDGTSTRTYPAPTDAAGTQGANCLYQVDAAAASNAAPLYRLVLTPAEKTLFDNIPETDTNTEFNATLVSQIGEERQSRYATGMRIRGASSREDLPRSLRVNVPNDRLWQGKSSLNFNSHYCWLELVGAYFARSAGLPAAYAKLVNVRMNGAQPTGSAGTLATHYGFYAQVEVLNGEFLDDTLPEDNRGNIYSKRSDTSADWAFRSGDIAAYLNDGWSKQTNQGVYQWGDLDHCLEVINAAAADNTISDTELAQINAVGNVSQWLRYFALNAILTNGENSLATGRDDDYSVYFGVDNRMIIVPHDFDTILGAGDSSRITTADLPYTIFDVAEAGQAGSTLPPLIPLFQRADIIREYYSLLRSLLDGPFERGTFDQTIDHLIGGLVPESEVAGLKSFMAARRSDILNKVASPLTASSSAAVQSGYPRVANSVATSNVTGTYDISQTAQVLVDGAPATLDPRAGTYSLQVPSATRLRPGLNRITVETRDAAGGHLDLAWLDIWRDTGAVVNKGGVIASQTWTAAGGPYFVNSNLTVGNGVTLTIAAGATVYLGNGINITTTGSGRIVAEGTEFNHIRWSRRPGTTDLGGRIFQNASTTECRFIWNDFEFCGASQVIEATNSMMLVSHCTFMNSDVQYLSTHNSSFIVEDSYFQTYTKPATWPASGGRPEMLHAADGLPANGYGIYRRNIFGHTYGSNDVIDFSGGNRPGAIVQVLENILTAATDDHLDLDSTDVYVAGNVMLHCHQDPARADARDTASCVSGGQDTSEISEWTVFGNLIYDTDHAVLAKGRNDQANTTANRFAFLDNTVCKVTGTSLWGSVGVDIAAFNFSDSGAGIPPASAGAGAVIANNVIWNATALVANYDPLKLSVTMTNNVLPLAWNGPGSGNVVVDAGFDESAFAALELVDTGSGPKVPSEHDYRKVWKQAHAAFALCAGSAAQGTGPGGIDRGGNIPNGVTVTGAPEGTTRATAATLMVGPGGSFHPSGSGIPAFGYGFVSYKWTLNGGQQSAETPIATPITLTGLAPGTHTVQVWGKNDSGNGGTLSWQTAPTIRTWTIDPAYSPTVVINEVLARNVNAYSNGSSHPDFIELHNPGVTSIDLSGWGISDDPANPFRATVPANTVLAPGEYRVALADSDAAAPGWHLGYSLDPDGDSVTLTRSPASGGGVVDSISFGLQLPDLSIGRLGAARAWALAVPTPGLANVAQPWCEPDHVRINEWVSSGAFQFQDDYIELFNASPLPAALGGVWLGDDPAFGQKKHQLKPLSFIAGRGFAVLKAAGEPSPQAANQLGFQLDSFTEWIVLSDAALARIDEVQFQCQPDDVTAGRVPDGIGSVRLLDLPTFGFSNGALAVTTTTAVPLVGFKAANWSYDRTSTVTPANWKTTGGTWSTGAGALGLDSDISDVDATFFGTNFGTIVPSRKTYYFRRSFPFSGTVAGTQLRFSTYIDDGAVIYLNGTEVHSAVFPRIRMAGAIGTAVAFGDDASATGEVGVTGAAVNPPEVSSLIPATGLLVNGNNVLAVEVHQRGTSSSDVVMDVKLEAVTVTTTTPSDPPGYTRMRDLLANLRITELLYDPINGTNYEFIELRNLSTTKSLDLTGVRITKGVDFIFPTMMLGPGAYCVVVKNVAAFQSVYGTGVVVAGTYEGKLANEGDEIRLELPSPWLSAIQIFSYQGWWFPQADGGGGSLEVSDDTGSRRSWNERAGWKASGNVGGSPGGRFAVHNFATWLAAYGLNGPNVDTDFDGLLPLTEYGLGLIPTVADLHGFQPVSIAEAGHLAISFTLPAFAPPDVIYRVEVTDDLGLGKWSAIASKTGNGAWYGPASVATGAPVGGRVPIVVTDAGAVLAYTRRFIRLSFAQP